MKRYFLDFAVTLILSVSLTGTAIAQNDLGINEEHLPGMPHRVGTVIPGDSILGNQLKDTDERSVRRVQENYPAETDEPCYMVKDRSYLERVIGGAVQPIGEYNRNSMLHCLVKYYGAEKLPGRLRHIVKSVYCDYSITMVAEIDINDRDTQTTYMIYIEDGSISKIVTVCNDEILGVEEIQNG